jgi:hypothetical protein
MRIEAALRNHGIHLGRPVMSLYTEAVTWPDGEDIVKERRAA